MLVSQVAHYHGALLLAQRDARISGSALPWSLVTSSARCSYLSAMLVSQVAHYHGALLLAQRDARISGSALPWSLVTSSARCSYLR
ncbi:hypothetical protein RRG08_008171 [Elysia crispata]|uniref:Uncharacterized protein n=1 Tax=Elysia crispata TaxID=231223 RepID=A0AAE0Z5D5_9GAST|nr:hypothetical protein RRG08_008171 [Elysia crispata]